MNLLMPCGLLFCPARRWISGYQKEGKEHSQGVAYLDDGTMIVVDNARHLIGQGVKVVVTSVLQTSAGRMIFARLENDNRPQGWKQK